MNEHKSVGRNDATAWGFGSEKRADPMKGTLSPGPGAYRQKSIAFDHQKPKFYMGERIERKSCTNVPPSWQYDPKVSTIAKSNPSFSMKMKLGSSMVSRTAHVPGPGRYHVNASTRKQAPQYGFGSCTRDKVAGKKFMTPGPGAYLLPSGIGDVPDHAMPNRSKEYKYV